MLLHDHGKEPQMKPRLFDRILLAFILLVFIAIMAAVILSIDSHLSVDCAFLL